MKKHTYFSVALALILLFAWGCKKDDEGPKQLKIITTFLDANTVVFEHNNAFTGIPAWDFGNGETSDQNSDTVVYPFAGTYTVKLTIFATDGEKTDTTEVVITQSDPSLLNLTEKEILLCGGADSVNGKTWVWAQTVPQHMMLGQWEPWQWWWGAAPNEKEPFNLYDDLMIFKAFNFEYDLINHDTTYVNVDHLGELGFDGSEDTPEYLDLSDSHFTWKIEERADGDYLTFTNGGFMSYYLGVSEYKIEALTENMLDISVIINNVYWKFRFMTPGYDHPDAVNPDENPNESPATSVDQLVDDFETDGDILWLFQAQGGGGSGDDEFANPFPGGINTSATIYKYVKGTWEYSNASMELGFNIDVNTNNQVRMKVYFPSTNDYSGTLKQKASVKFQRWQELDNAWMHQAEVIQLDVPLDTWTELTFDFTSITIPAERMSGFFDKIVIQFGDEGHTVDGTFYFDDFEVVSK
jgi:PKD repeat protein